MISTVNKSHPDASNYSRGGYWVSISEYSVLTGLPSATANSRSLSLILIADGCKKVFTPNGTIECLELHV